MHVGTEPSLPPLRELLHLKSPDFLMHVCSVLGAEYRTLYLYLTLFDRNSVFSSSDAALSHRNIHPRQVCCFFHHYRSLSDFPVLWRRVFEVVPLLDLETVV